MDKVYRLLPWLSIEQALTWLQAMTSCTQLTKNELIELCGAGQCDVYLDCKDWLGITNDEGVAPLDEHTEEIFNETVEKLFLEKVVKQSTKVVGVGFCKVMHPADLNQDRYATSVMGPVMNYSPDINKRYIDSIWIVLSQCDNHPDLAFKSTDIQLLADKMNGMPDSTKDIETLHQQIHQIQQERALMQKRAERAEQIVVSLDRQLAEQAELRKKDNDAIEKMAKQLSEYHINPPVQTKPHASASAGLTFPYATKELAAMHSAVAKYWEDYTADKRQPKQKEIGIHISELLGLPITEGKELTRKAMTLAAVIKPVDLPDI